VDVRIGITDTPKEIDLDLGDKADADALRKDAEKYISSGDGVFWLTDRRGRTVGVPAIKIAYIEIGADKSDHRVGFVG
jgi:hypothetical protein